MRAVVFHGIGDIRLDNVPEPKLQAPTDAIVRLTASAICGTDLHMIRGTMPGMKAGTILGHEVTLVRCGALSMLRNGPRRILNAPGPAAGRHGRKDRDAANRSLPMTR